MPLALPGDRIDGRYRVVRPLGAGAMAEVFEAHDDETGREVALKLVKQAIAADAANVARLEREVHVQRLIQHRNVAAIHGAGVTPRGQPYLVVELLRGRSLRNVLKTEPRVDLVRAASYVWQALQGLGATHAVGVLHRDLKPANLMLEPSPGPVERVVLIDFGFAAVAGQARLTAHGHVVGSLAYVAPERLHGSIGDGRADLYGMAIILYELIAGRRPFVGSDELELITMQLDAAPPPPSAVAPDAGIPPALDAVILRALAKHPDGRQPSAAAMAAELEVAIRSIG